MFFKIVFVFSFFMVIVFSLGLAGAVQDYKNLDKAVPKEMIEPEKRIKAVSALIYMMLDSLFLSIIISGFIWGI